MINAKLRIILPTLPSDPPLRPPGGLTGQNKTRLPHCDDGLYAGLPIRFTRPTEKPSNFYINGNDWRVERIDKKGIRHSMSIEVYEKNTLLTTLRHPLYRMYYNNYVLSIILLFIEEPFSSLISNLSLLNI